LRRCHDPKTEHTNRTAVPLREMPPPRGFDRDPDLSFKTPSLLYVGGTAPYYHDGSSSSLDELLRKNDDRMGVTKQLGKEERAALVAYLETL
jgi:cytochrome c peroxidase